MKKLLIVFLALIFCAQLANAQATEFQKKEWWYKVTLDSAAGLGQWPAAGDCTFVMPIPGNRGKGLPILYVLPDSIDGEGDAAITDKSLQIQYRPHFGLDREDSLVSSANAAIAWKNLQIYNGPAAALADFNLTSWTGTDSLWRMCIFNMAGYPWRYVEIKVSHADNEENDSLNIYFEFDID